MRKLILLSFFSTMLFISLTSSKPKEKEGAKKEETKVTEVIATSTATATTTGPTFPTKVWGESFAGFGDCVCWVYDYLQQKFFMQPDAACAGVPKSCGNLQEQSIVTIQNTFLMKGILKKLT